MDWKAVATQLANIGLPILGAAVAGPAGAVAAKGLLAAIGLSSNATPEQVAATLGSLNGDQLAKMKELETDLAKAQLVAAQAQVEAVNKTLQAEQTGGSFWQRNHHAFECTLSLLFLIAVYFVLPILNIPVPPIPETAFVMIGSILGVTAWQRGKTNQILADQA